ncbi:MAG: zf-HC2 domain-containing protein [Chloroflexi bacterium]|nr:zf-HC2 domain-containing protein [Chloroflexota bacterium]
MSRMRCAQVRRELAVHRDLDEAQRARIQEHLALCADCAERFATYLAQDALLGGLERIEPSPRFYEQVQARTVQRPAAHPTSRFVPVPQLLAVGLVLLLVLFGGAWRVAADALPGDALYGVKRAGEEIRLALTVREEARQKYTAELAERRREEARQVIALGRETQVQFEGPVEAVQEQDGVVIVAGLPVRVDPKLSPGQWPTVGSVVAIEANASQGRLEAGRIIIKPTPTLGAMPTWRPTRPSASAPPAASPTVETKPSFAPSPYAVLTVVVVRTPTPTMFAYPYPALTRDIRHLTLTALSTIVAQRTADLVRTVAVIQETREAKQLTATTVATQRALTPTPALERTIDPERLATLRAIATRAALRTLAVTKLPRTPTLDAGQVEPRPTAIRSPLPATAIATRQPTPDLALTKEAIRTRLARPTPTADSGPGLPTKPFIATAQPTLQRTPRPISTRPPAIEPTPLPPTPAEPPPAYPPPPTKPPAADVVPTPAIDTSAAPTSPTEAVEDKALP